jgi:flagellar basal body-associated protein FliL
MSSQQGSSKKKLIMILGLAIVGGTGLTAAAVYGVSLMGGASHAAHGEAGHDTHLPEHSTAEAREVDLGEYAVTAYQPDSGATLLISFHLYGTVHHEAEEAFAELFEAHKHRARQHVLVSVRNAEMADLMDPGLGLIRRQVQHHLNATFGRPLLEEVVFSDFLITER